MKISLMLAIVVAALSAGVAHAADATAAQNVTKACAAKYQAEKAAGTLGKQTWVQYLAACGKEGAEAPVAAAKAKVKAKAQDHSMHKMAPAAGGQEPTPAQKAMYARMRKCGQMWKADKAAGKTGKKTWPQYWDACNERVK